VEELTSLKRAYLDFSECDRLTGTGFQRVIKSLKVLSSLENLHLVIDRHPDAIFLSLGKTLKPLKSLRTLELDISLPDNKLTDTVLSKIQEELGTLTSLKKFILYSPYCPQITDTGLKPLSEGLSKHIFLENTNLDFSYCNAITDIGGQKISEKLRTFISLQSIKLCFCG